MDFNRLAKKSTIKFSSKKIGEEDRRVLIDVLRRSEVLKILDIRFCGGLHNEFFADGLAKNSTLLDLILHGNEIGNKSVKLLGEMLQSNSTLLSISLRHIQFSEEGLNSIFDALKVNRALKRLELFDCDIGDSGAACFAECLGQNQTLEGANLERNNITGHGCKRIAEGLMSNSSLQWLYLNNNDIRDDGARSLAALFRKNTALSSIVLEHCNIGDEGGRELAGALKHNTRIREIRLVTGNPVSCQMIQKIQSNVKKRSKATSSPRFLCTRMGESVNSENPSQVKCNRRREESTLKQDTKEKRRKCPIPPKERAPQKGREEKKKRPTPDSALIDPPPASDINTLNTALFQREARCQQLAGRPHPAGKSNLTMTATTFSPNFCEAKNDIISTPEDRIDPPIPRKAGLSRDHGSRKTNRTFLKLKMQGDVIEDTRGSECMDGGWLDRMGTVDILNGHREGKQRTIVPKPASTKSPFEMIEMHLNHIKVNSAETQEHNAKLLKEKADLERKREFIQEANKNLGREKIQLEKKCDSLLREMGCKEACIEDLRGKSRKLEVELGQSKKDSTVKDDEIRKLKMENQTMREKLAKKEMEIIALSDRLSEKEELNQKPIQQRANNSGSNINSSNLPIMKVEVKEETDDEPS